MEMTIHARILLHVFVSGVVIGAVTNKTSFCTPGAASDWVTMGDRGGLRAWLFAMTVTRIGLLVPEASGSLRSPPPHAHRRVALAVP